MIKMIKLLILDIDGVMTDGTKLYGLDGLTMGKRYCDRDFTAIKQFKASGVQVCFLSGDDKVNEMMAINRNTDFYYSRRRKKTDFISEFIKKYNCDLDEMAYVGDDIFDIPIMEIVGYSFCPSDVTDQVKEASTLVIDGKSGDNIVSKLYEYTVKHNLVNTCTLSQIDALDRLETF